MSEGRWTTKLKDAIRYTLSDIKLIKESWDKETKRPEAGILSEDEAEIHEVMTS
jgi:hypothetical protein